MPRGPLWIVGDHKHLELLVRACGKSWTLMAGRWKRAPMRSADALRNEWNKRATWEAAPASGDSDSSSASSVSAQSQEEMSSHRVRAALDLIEALMRPKEAVRGSKPNNCSVVRGVILRQMAWIVPTEQVRLEWCGRSWARAGYRLMARAQESSTAALDVAIQPKHLELAVALRLDEATPPHRLFYCEMVRARRLWSDHLLRTKAANDRAEATAIIESTKIDLSLRDSLEIVIYAGQAGTPTTPIPTILASGFRRACIGGPDASALHYAGPEHVMAWMGFAAGGARAAKIAEAAEACLPAPRSRFRAAGDAVAMTTAVAAVASAFALLGAEPRGDLTYVSLYSGAFDTFLRALRWVQERRWPRARVVPLVAAEKAASRRKLLRHSENYVLVLKSAAKAAQLPLKAVTMLTATPECPTVSKGNQMGGTTAEARARAAAKAMRRFASVLATAVLQMQPRLVLVEQVEGLATHYTQLLQFLLRKMRLACPTYVWYARLDDAGSTIGRAPHHRRRLILVAVATTPATAQAVAAATRQLMKAGAAGSVA